MGPTLERMVKTIDDMNQLLRAAELQKQDSMTESLQNMMHGLQGSISDTLHTMSERFSQSLTGSAMAQFEKIGESLGGTASLLQHMNSQFQTTQSAMADLVGLVKNLTLEQMALGKSQVEELTNVQRQLMVQLNETAS